MFVRARAYLSVYKHLYICTLYIGNEAGVRTRSKAEAQPFQWTTVPVLVKIFKLIINELSNDIEIINATQESEVCISIIIIDKIDNKPI